MKAQTLADVLRVWAESVCNQHENALKWALEAYRLQPDNYTANNLAYAKVAAGIARHLIYLIPGGYDAVEISDTWREIILNHKRVSAKKKRTLKQIQESVTASTDVQAAVSQLAAKYSRGRG